MDNKKALAGLAVLALAASACASPVASPSPSPAPSASPSGAASGPPSPSPSPADPHAELTAAMAGEYDGITVDVVAPWIEAQGVAFDTSLDAFRDATGINVVYSGISNYESVLGVRVDGGLAPDIAQLAQPGNMRAFQADDKLVALDDVLDLEAVTANYSPGFVADGSVDGTLYGLYYSQVIESIVWYPVQQFADAGYEVPTTWDELVELSDRIVADGSNPWCTSVEHGDFSGWVATDWIEDVLLRTAPVETYDQWVSHEIPFNDPAVINAANIVATMLFTDGYTYGGSTRMNATWIGDSQGPMFDPAGPKCWMHKQAHWMPDFWPKDALGNPLFEPGADTYAVFYLPPVDEEYGRPVVGPSDMFVMFRDRPAVRALMQWFSTPESVADRVASGDFLAANNAVPLSDYETYPLAALAAIAHESTLSRADASDSMPATVGQGKGTFLQGMVKWITQSGEGTEQIFADIEAAWPSD
jgi:alpha-glucoside transport system substrate-binding protein